MKMLIKEHKTLVDSALVVRKKFGEVPPRVEYSLIDYGRNIKPLIEPMIAFAKLFENPNTHKPS